MLLACEQCGRKFARTNGEVKYRRRRGIVRTFCGLRCFGLSRRCGKTSAQRKAEKSAYDKAYREKYRERLRRQKAAYFRRWYTPEIGRRWRAARPKGWHTEYCRRYYSDPHRKAQKVAYDADRRAATYGEYAEAHKLLLLLQRQVRTLIPNKYERLKARGYYDRPTAKDRRRHAQIERR